METIVFSNLEKDDCDDGGVCRRTMEHVSFFFVRPNGTYLRDCRLSIALRAKGRVPEVDNEQEIGIVAKLHNDGLPVWSQNIYLYLGRRLQDSVVGIQGLFSNDIDIIAGRVVIAAVLIGKLHTHRNAHGDWI